MNMSLESDRRQHPRTTATRPAKVFLPSALRYAPAQTSDVSAGGALVCVERARALKAGDVIEVVSAADRYSQGGVIESKSMVRGRIVRVTPMDHHQQAVAIRFDEPQTLAAAA